MNKNTINMLKQNIDSKLDNQNSLVEIKNLYVAFLENNTCIICEEYFEDIGKYQKSILYNYFNGESVSSRIIDKFSKVQLPYSRDFRTNEGIKGIAFPIETFLSSYIKRGLVVERNIIAVYDVINDYINNNPTFINDMFQEKSKKY